MRVPLPTRQPRQAISGGMTTGTKPPLGQQRAAAILMSVSLMIRRSIYRVSLVQLHGMYPQLRCRHPLPPHGRSMARHLITLGRPPRLLRVRATGPQDIMMTHGRTGEGQDRDYAKVCRKENPYHSQAAQEDAPMEPARAEAAQTMQGHAGGTNVPVLPLHQLHPQPSLLSQLARYQPPADDPMEVDPDAGQPVRRQAPSTPTDAQVTDVDDADSEAPTQCTQNYTVLPPGETGGLWRNGRFRGVVPTRPAPRATHPPPGLEAATATQDLPPTNQPPAPQASRRQEIQQWTDCERCMRNFV